MTESFAQLFEESLKEIETRPGSIVRGVVVAIDKDVVLVDAGLKSESAIPAEQFKNARLSRKTRSLLQFLTVTPLFVNYFKILCCVS